MVKGAFKVWGVLCLHLISGYMDIHLIMKEGGGGEVKFNKSSGLSPFRRVL